MPVGQNMCSLPLRYTLSLLALIFGADAARAKEPTDLAGTWDLSLPRVHASCRIMLQAQRSDRGDYFLGMPTPCRHAMPGVERVGRWAMPDATHLTFNDPAGTAVLTFVAFDNGFTAAAPEGAYALAQIGASRPAVAKLPDNTMVGEPVANVVPIVSKRAAKEEETPRETPGDLAGRYAVMREKHDTGCMVTLDDKSRAKSGGGDRAQLAPGCRDQGIVIFDPSGWQIVKGDLVLTARAGHKARLKKEGEGSWQKDATDGGKPLGLKKL